MDDLPPDELLSSVPDDLPPDPVTALEPVSRGASVPYTTAVIRRPAAELLASLAALEAYPVATASPEERADLLELRDVLDAIAAAVRIRIGAIDLAFKRGMEELAAREIPVEGWGPVRYVPDEGAWEVHADALLADLRGLRQYGLVTDEDLERAFTVVTTVKADNRVLNGLMKRGTAVVDAIERNRTRREGQPMAGKLTLPKRRRGGTGGD
jgi:hypothetical protein